MCVFHWQYNAERDRMLRVYFVCSLVTYVVVAALLLLAFDV